MMQKGRMIYFLILSLIFCGSLLYLNIFSDRKTNYHLRILDEPITQNSLIDTSVLQNFIEFKWDYTKVYNSKQSEKQAFSNFVQNNNYINQRNLEANGSLILKMNEFGDISPKVGPSTNQILASARSARQKTYPSKVQQILNAQSSYQLLKEEALREQNERFFNNNTRRLLQSNCQNYQGCLQVDLPRSQLPLQVNHRNKTGPVRDDYPCWRGTVAFSNANLIEFLLYENTSWTNYRNISRQQIYDCALNYSSIMPFPSTLCQQNSIEFAQSPFWLFVSNTGSGINEEQDYNVTWSSTIDASRCSSNTNSNTSHFLWLWDVNPGNHTQILNQLVYRPVAISFDADQQDILFYSSGVIENGCDTNLTPDGQLLIVGYDLTPGNEHYILKNNWSESYGDGGYLKIKIPATDDNSTLGTCGINFSVESYSYHYTGLNNAW